MVLEGSGRKRQSRGAPAFQDSRVSRRAPHLAQAPAPPSRGASIVHAIVRSVTSQCTRNGAQAPAARAERSRQGATKTPSDSGLSEGVLARGCRRRARGAPVADDVPAVLSASG